MDKVQERDLIELVMRQSEVYDVNVIRAKLVEHAYDVVSTVCDLMNIREKEKPNDEFSNMREILEEKDRLFHSRVEPSK